MMNVFAQLSRARPNAGKTGTVRIGSGGLRPIRTALILSSALVLPGTAWADCTPPGAAAGSTVTCSGNSASYTDLNPNLTVNADGTAVVVAPLIIGTNSTLTVASGGSILGSTAAPAVQFGDFATITNNGTITASSSTSGAAAIQAGINSTVTNNGTLTAAAGTPVVTFVAQGFTSSGGTFVNGATAPTAVIGNILFGYNSGASVGTFINVFNSTTTATSTATYGLTGNVIGNGNLRIDNEGQWTGSLAQTSFNPSGGALVFFTNGTEASFNGAIATGDTTMVINNATGTNPAGVGYGMLLGNGTSLGVSAGATSSLVNNGVLTVGSTTAPALVTINGNFTQTGTNAQTGVTPVLNMAIVGAGGTVSGPLSASASQPYSQIYAIGGTAALAGTLNVNVVSGFFPLGTRYDLIVADKGITGNFSTVNIVNANGAALPFIKFTPAGTAVQNGVVPTGNVNDPTQQAYEFVVAQVNLASPFAGVLQAAGVGTKNQLAVATALAPLVTVANAAPTGQEAALIGQIDQLTIPQAQSLFDQLSPAGLISYADALRDEANNFERQIWLRMGDQNSDHAEDGWWGSANGQVDVSKATNDTAKQSLFGFNLGYDLSGPHHVFGIAGNASFDSLHNGDKTLTGHNRDFAVAAYGGYLAGPIHLTGQLAYNLGHLSTTRTITLGTTNETATGTASEHLFKATGTAGFMLHAGGYTIEPFGGIDFMRGKINGFTENGVGAAALTVAPISADRTDVLGGVSLTRSSGKLRPYLRAVYRSELGNSGASTVSAYFDGNSATAFTVAGVRAARHEEDINAGLNFVFEDAGSLFIGYQGTLRSGFTSHGINLGLRLEF